jgi:hypothetical protein
MRDGILSAVKDVDSWPHWKRNSSTMTKENLQQEWDEMVKGTERLKSSAFAERPVPGKSFPETGKEIPKPTTESAQNGNV